MKAYIASSSENGIDNIEGAYFLITEEGELLATHWCSNKLYALGDLYTCLLYTSSIQSLKILAVFLTKTLMTFIF